MYYFQIHMKWSHVLITTAGTEDLKNIGSIFFIMYTLFMWSNLANLMFYEVAWKMLQAEHGYFRGSIHCYVRTWLYFQQI